MTTQNGIHDHQMEILTRPIDPSRLAEILSSATQWRYSWPHWGVEASEHCKIVHYHRLGWSPNERIWVFAVRDELLTGRRDGQSSWELDPVEEAIEFVLIDPPVQDRSVIEDLFYRLHTARQDEPAFGQERTFEIVEATEFVRYPTVASYLPEAPEGWLELRAGLAHDFELSENSFISPSTWSAYHRTNLGEALQVLHANRYPGILVGYYLVTTEVTPLLEWNIDWPLSRRGTTPPERRGKLQGGLPWEEVADTQLLSIRQDVPWVGSVLAPHHDMEPTVNDPDGSSARLVT